MKKFRDSKVLSIICEAILMIIEKSNLLKNSEPDRYECINCKNVFDRAQECQCGSNIFLLNSKKYEIKGSEIVCGCEKGKLKSICHYDCDDGFIEEYICSRCKNVISIYEYMKYEDEIEYEDGLL